MADVPASPGQLGGGEGRVLVEYSVINLECGGGAAALTARNYEKELAGFGLEVWTRSGIHSFARHSVIIDK